MFMPKRIVLLLSAFLFATSLFSPARAAELPSKFSFSGAGYGHGVGLSQIGAKARALAGESATSILEYYYSGTKVETTTDSQILRINVGHLLTAATFKSNSPNAVLQLFTGDIADTSTAVPLAILGSKMTLGLSVSNSLIATTWTNGLRTFPLATGTSFTLRWSGTRYLSGATALLSLTQQSGTVIYKYGQMNIKLVADKFLEKRMEITNSVRLHDEYLWGIGEVPSSWPAASLEAQAIASRTYALAKSKVMRAACDCQMYANTSDQAFVGYSKESEKQYGQLWKEAVSRTSIESTTGLAVMQNGKPIMAYFTSSTGGVTETAFNAWGTASVFTQSVSDSASVDAVMNARYASWTRSVTQAIVATAFRLPDVMKLEVLAINPTGTVAQIRATSISGASVTLKGETFRARSKLPSAWFSIRQ